MKEHIYTIPVIDCFKEESECAFCTMYSKLDSEATDYMLGSSYMEDDVRAETNKIGFCSEHYKKMYAKQNRLGLALLLHTHLKQIGGDLAALKASESKPKKSIFSQNKQNRDNTKIYEYITNINNSCYICNKINKTFERYVDTFFHLWQKDGSILDGCKGFCLPHFLMLLNLSKDVLKPNAYEEFEALIFKIQHDNLKILEDDLGWFIDKFDYRYANEPWKNSKDALPRALTKISSIIEE